MLMAQRFVDQKTVQRENNSKKDESEENRQLCKDTYVGGDVLLEVFKRRLFRLSGGGSLEADKENDVGDDVGNVAEGEEHDSE
jgi:hypothetical protein